MTPLRTFLKVWAELGKPNVYLVHRKQYENVDGPDMGDAAGISSDYAPILAVAAKWRKKPLRGKALLSTIYHEIAHHLWPWRKEWWIEAFGEKMAGGGGQGFYCRKYGHTADELPPRQRLLRLAQLASARFNRKEN